VQIVAIHDGVPRRLGETNPAAVPLDEQAGGSVVKAHAG
jgi:hypothetical protein